MDFGPLFITAGIAQAARDDVGFLSEILECLRRYQLGDWGDLCPEDMQLNEAALRTGARLMGAYTTKRGGKIWIITEAADDNGYLANVENLYLTIPCTISKGYSSGVYWETITGSDNSSVAVFNNIAGTTPDLFGAVKVSTVGAQTAAGTYTGKIYFNIQILNY